MRERLGPAGVDASRAAYLRDSWFEPRHFGAGRCTGASEDLTKNIERVTV